MVIQLLLCIALVICLFCFPNAAHLGAEHGMTIFLDILLPYLLPYILLTTWLFSLLNAIKSSPQTRFYTSYLTSAIGGYPIGAMTTVTLFEQGIVSKKQAQWLLPFLHSPNPFFVINFVGRDLLDDVTFSLLFFVIHHCVCFVCAFVIFRKGIGTINPTQSAPPLSFQRMIEKTAMTLVTIAVTIIFFTCLSFIAVELLKGHVATNVLIFIVGMLELTNGLQFANELLHESSLPLYFAFLLSFQSISIHLQVAAVSTHAKLSLKPYIFVRILYTALFCTIFYFL